MKRSLFLRILLPLILTLSLCWIIFIAILGRASYKELYEVLDQQMIQTAHMLTVPMDYKKLPELRFSENVDQDYAIHFVVWDKNSSILVADKRGHILPSSFGENGFYKIRNDDEEYRVYTYHNLDTETSASAGYPSSVKKEILWEVVEKLWFPSGLGLFALAVVTLLSLWWGLRPLKSLQKEIQQRGPHNLEKFSTEVPFELKNLKEELNRLVDQIRRQIEKERRFTADAAHELKTPLTAIRIQTEVLALELPEGGLKLQSQKILQGVDRTNRLIEQLLTLSRLDEKQFQTKNESLNVKAIFQEEVNDLRDFIEKKSAHITITSSDDFALQGDKFLLGILFKNLIENSLKYSSDGVKIELHIDRQGFSVKDSGPGLPSEMLSRVHERFYRPEGQLQTGSGLGLSIAERIAELHGLKMKVENAPEKGLKVSFYT